MPSFKKFSQILDPSTSRLFVFLDVHEDEIFDSHFGIPTAEWFPNSREWWDVPANRHGQAANLSFADGHAELYKWKAPKSFSGWPAYVRPKSCPTTCECKAGCDSIGSKTTPWGQTTRLVQDQMPRSCN